MKTKKVANIFIFTILVLLPLVLTGCGSNKKDLIKYIDHQKNQKKVTTTFDVTLDQLIFPSSNKKGFKENKISESFLLDFLKEFKIKGKSDLDGSDMQMNATVDYIINEFDHKTVFKDNHFYFGTDFLSSIISTYNVINKSHSKTDISQIDYNEFKNRYIEFNSLAKILENYDKENNNNTKEVSKNLKYLKKLFNISLKMHEINNSTLNKTIDRISEKEISKKNNIIKVVLDKKAIDYYLTTFLNKIKPTLGKSYNDSQKGLQQSKSLFKNYSYTINFNEKDSRFNNYLQLEPKDGSKVRFKFNYTYSEFKGKIKKPTENSMMSPYDFYHNLSKFFD